MVFNIIQEIGNYSSQAKDIFYAASSSLSSYMHKNPAAANFLATNHPALALYAFLCCWITGNFLSKTKNLEEKIKFSLEQNLLKCH